MQNYIFTMRTYWIWRYLCF